MTKHKGKIKIAEKPMKIINWFTKKKNYNNEIGALGIGEMRDGLLCVDRLVFPKQIVNGAHVHFKPEDWSSIIQELSNEDLSKIIFYWHRHPGCAKASQGDEEDTFDVFMGEESERNFFGFLQTAEKMNGEIEYEGRIEMRTPIFASITDVQILTDKDLEIEEECKNIIKEKVKFGHASASDQPGSKKIKTPETLINKKQDNHYEYQFDKDIEAFMDVEQENGVVVITVPIFFEEMIYDALFDPNINGLYKNTNTLYKGNNAIIKVKPMKKKLKTIFNFFKEYKEELFGEQEAPTIETKVNKYRKEKIVKDNGDLLEQYIRNQNDPFFYSRYCS